MPPLHNHEPNHEPRQSAPLPKGNPKLPEQINNRNEHPLKDFLLLAGALLALMFILTLLLGWSAQWLGPKIPYSWESRWFSSAPEAVSGALQPSTQDTHAADTARQQALQQLLDNLLSQQSAPLKVRLHWLAHEDPPNAFATLGGHIFVTRGLLTQVTSENALAMVLAHEYAHVEQRHPITLALEQLALSLLGSVIGSEGAASMIGQHTSLLTLLSFSRDMERSADQRALEILQSHYGHSAGADEFFRNMLNQHDESRWALMFQTHPLTSERLQQISQAGSATVPVTTSQLTPLPALLQLNDGADSKEAQIPQP
ncbi:M48 family metallopeptidase [Thalassolituus hydrocarboniclasticus]|uniref:M48 family metallopeptidase n=1 Tax=Thalassolituus hydrocarboniclasticus TaxID=2742796 RepID=A0ABY6ADD2_9GAMM|nr:M48 family metallopeptidase [Thalassolituus hydrocarboniclasticus]